MNRGWKPIEAYKPYSHKLFGPTVIFCIIEKIHYRKRKDRPASDVVACTQMWIGGWSDYSGFDTNPKFNGHGGQPTHWRRLPRTPLGVECQV